jgi:hypothetical protein
VDSSFVGQLRSTYSPRLGDEREERGGGERAAALVERRGDFFGRFHALQRGQKPVKSSFRGVLVVAVQGDLSSCKL